MIASQQAQSPSKARQTGYKARKLARNASA
jgi:hypothetical protein